MFSCNAHTHTHTQQDETVAKLELLQQRIRTVKTLFRNKDVSGF